MKQENFIVSNFNLEKRMNLSMIRVEKYESISPA